MTAAKAVGSTFYDGRGKILPRPSVAS